VKVHLARIGSYPLADTMAQLALHSRRHEVVDSPEAADLVLLCGSFSYNPEYLLENSVYRAHRAKCAVYTCDDAYLALAPGVYASPRRGVSTHAGRVRSHAYAWTFGGHGNPAVELARTAPLAPAGEPEYLFSFVGSPNSTLRRRLLRRYRDAPGIQVRDSLPYYKHFDHSAPGRDEGQSSYVDTIRSSAFVLCPRGWGTGSLRLFEVMSLGGAPVLLADAYVLPRGPDWDSFLLRVPERKIGALAEVLGPEAGSSRRRGEQARAEWEKWFSEAVLFDGIVDAAAEAWQAGRRWDPLYRRIPAVLVRLFRLRLWATQAATRALGLVRQSKPGAPKARAGTTPARRAAE